MNEKILKQLLDINLKKLMILKFFLKNPNDFFQLEKIISRTKIENKLVKKYLKLLLKLKVLKTKKLNFVSKKGKKKKEIVYSLNNEFPLNNELLNIILKTTPDLKSKILKQIKKLGKIQLAIISGIFINYPNSQIDLFLVGDVNNKRIHDFIKKIEIQIGKEINYVLMPLKDFYYRYDMFDRFIKEIFEQPHEVLINKLKLNSSRII